MAKHAGTLLDPPPEDSLRDAGVLSFGGEDKGKDKGKDQHKDPAAQIEALMSKLEGNEGNSSPQPPAPLVTIGTGLPALPKKLIARVLANEYIDFSELPPAKGKGRPIYASLTRGPSCRGPGSRAVADQEDHSRSGHLGVVLLNLYHNSLCEVSHKVARINGLPDDYCKSQPTIPVAKLGGL